MTDADFNTNETESGPFKDQNLLLREHLDPDKHWIGEALPAAGATESKPSGSATGPGTSPFPARADHTHDSSIIFGHYYHNATSLIHTQTKYFDTWVYYSGRNLLQPASTQLFLFPIEGLWIITGQGQLYAPAAFNTVAGAWFGMDAVFNNVTYTPLLLTAPVPTPYTVYTFNFTWVMHIFPPVTPSVNFQLRASNYTGQTINFMLNWLNIRRDTSSVSA